MVHKILIIEDNPVTRKAMRYMLVDNGYEVLEARDGQSGLSILAQKQPSLLLQDLMLPDMDGFALVAQIREQKPYRHLPIIGISGSWSSEQEKKASQIGFTDLLTKPLKPSVLLAMLQRHLKGGEKAQQLTVLLADDVLVQRKLLQAHLHQRGYRVLEAKDGEEALALSRTERPDAVISDVLMPRLDGFKLCKALREDPAFAAIPVILISNNFVEKEDSALAMQMGATAYLMRTPSATELLEVLADSIERAAQQAAQRRAGPEHHTEQDTPPQENELEQEYQERISRQLERQSALNLELMREIELLVSQLSVLGGTSRVLASTLDLHEMLTEMLERYLDATGFPVGALYLKEEGQRLQFKKSVGLADDEGWQTFFGHKALLDRVLQSQQMFTLPTPDVPAQVEQALLARLGGVGALFAPLHFGDEILGIVVLVSSSSSMLREGMFFARAIGFQLGQVVLLGRMMTRLSNSEQRFRSITETAHEGIILTDASSQIIYANPAALRIFDYQEEGELVGHPVQMLLPQASGEPKTQEVEGIDRKGESISLDLSGSQFSMEKEPYTTYILRDIRERKRFEHQVSYLASYDRTTELFNRHRFQEELERRIGQSLHHEWSGVFALFDIDHFKVIHETYGPLSADEVLAEVAKLLGDALPGEPLLGRFGGDEFGIYMEEIAWQDGVKLLESLRQRIAEQVFSVGTQTLRLTVTFGVVEVSTESQSTEEVLRCAEKALDYGKRLGRNRICEYNPAEPWAQKSEGQLDWLEEIRMALVEDRFVLHFQPIMNMTTQQINTYEVLLRMRSREGALIYPGTFLPIAEQTSLIRDIDRWVMLQAIELLDQFNQQNAHFSFEVNLSAASLNDPGLLPMVRQKLLATSVPPSRLILEITETAAITNMAEAKRFVQTLKGLGCRFALDDFGVGFTSFQQLKHLPVDILKIDGSFIKELPRNEVDQHLVQAMAAVARSLHKETVAEFVEDQETVELLRRYQVDFAQGYHIGRPNATLLGH